MATQLSLYNGALKVLKQRKLSALTDTTEARYALDDEYAKCIAYCLEQGLWNFALRSVALDPEDEQTTAFSYTYLYTRPTDFVRLNAIGSNDSMYPPLEDFEVEANYYLANCNPLYMSYVSNDASYGNNLSVWPATFERYFEHELAGRCTGLLTGASAADIELLAKQCAMLKKDCRSKDALNQANKRPPPGRLTQARMGSRGASGGQAPWWRR